ncbi:MAG: magnesium-translocating P-type ATPase [Rickettsiales bacterium]|nr:magnesium-translocating P-type ATPase [Rickettsiales bacterium]
MKKEVKPVVDFKERLLTFSKLSFAEVIKKLKTDFDIGLEDDDVEYCHQRYGYNEIETVVRNSWYKRLYNSFITSFNIILFVIIGISFFTDYYLKPEGEKDLTSVIVISVMVFLSGILDFIQDTKSDKASEKLKAMIKTTTTVLRNNERVEIALNEVVPGDIIILSAGSIIPADLRILQAKDLFISQSSLTGESAPVEKYSEDICWLDSKTSIKSGALDITPFNNKVENDTLNNKEKGKIDEISPLELNNLCFMGTNVVSGSGIGVVISIGSQTYFGSLAKSISHEKVETSFDKGVKEIGFMLIKFVIVMAIAVFLINGFFKGDWVISFLFAVSVAIGLTPEMLPVIITTNLAKGALVMSKKKTIVKNLSSIQNFGAMDILCTDKTGTLTEDRIELEYHLNVHGEEDDRVFKHAYLNSYYQTGLKNLIDVAVLKHMDEHTCDIKSVETCLRDAVKRYHLIDEIPFDFTRKRMSVILRDNTGKTQLITKGAVETMLDICGFVEYEGQVEPLTSELKNEVLKRMAEFNNKGMRALGVAHKTRFDSGIERFSVTDEKEMVFIGFVAFLDPPKESAKIAIQNLNNYGVKIKVLTGDNDLVAKYVCEQVGLGSCCVLTGNEIQNMNDDKLANVIEEYDIFAKLTPEQKARIVSLLRSKGHVVGFMGDGINDALAMKKSDVAISVDTAVDIAKESADIILLEKDLQVLVNGVVEGRKIFGNIVKYIKMATSSNFGNMLSILVACAFLPFLPMLPLQILVLNLFYDISQTVIPWDNMDGEYLQKQKKWDIKSIKRFMIWLGPVSSIFDISMFFVLYFVFGCKDPYNVEQVAMFQTGWFVLSIITQTLIIHFVRTEKVPFIESIASKPVILMTAVLILIGLTMPFTSLGHYMKMVSLPASYYIWLAGLMFGYIVIISFVKRIYKKRYGNWL